MLVLLRLSKPMAMMVSKTSSEIVTIKVKPRIWVLDWGFTDRATMGFCIVLGLVCGFW
jgi:hypothetical protein